MKYRTRIAPSPTGIMHIGTARTALFNWLAAKSTNGEFILRIDDTDTSRNNELMIKPIIEGLVWLGLEWDEFYKQSDRLDIYKSYAYHLKELRLAREVDNGAIILNYNNNMPDEWYDEIAGNIILTDTDKKQIHNLVLLRGEPNLNNPTYHFASVVDDYLMNINYIIRGTDHISNTSKQLGIWWALSKLDVKKLPKFAHIGLIMKNKKKISKRDNDNTVNLLDFKEKEYCSDAIFNCLLRLGWGPKIDNKENSILTRNQAINMFLEHGNMRNVNSNFDENKLNWFNKKLK